MADVCPTCGKQLPCNKHGAGLFESPTTPTTAEEALRAKPPTPIELKCQACGSTQRVEERKGRAWCQSCFLQNETLKAVERVETLLMGIHRFTEVSAKATEERLNSRPSPIPAPEPEPECPRCGAKPGMLCVDKDSMERVTIHKARRKVWFE